MTVSVSPSVPREPVPHTDTERESFRAAMRHLVGGVSIITVGGGAERGGLTATSVTSLSADPPSLLVCVKQSASGLPLLKSHGRFGVSILGHEHQAIADRFAGRDGSQGADRFAGGDWIGGSDYPPVLANALASFECDVEDLVDRFSHTIVIGRVRETRAFGGDGALVYWRAGYNRLG
ncbi:flavin reductase family protein [Beijerinckia sp. L45]|uniref:flavin reductase family protein n=1 Tax=Beijerinckia sp. L45 TaxID=1641855 RepID=UPI00131DE1A3|nr:flavin reductase family protein [Beijerinckia sp. L45]